MTIKRVSDLAVSGLVFLAVFAGHFVSGNNFSFDSRWSIHTAMSIIKEGNTDLDEYKDLIARTFEETPTTETIDGHIHNLYPIGSSILALPFVYAIDQFAGRVLSFDLNEHVKQVVPEGIELFIACFVIALTAVIIYRIARLSMDRPRSLALVFIFAFCTSAWSTASRALWQHGPSMLMLAIALYIILLAKDRPALIQFASAPLAFSYVIRPTNSISIALLAAFVFVQYRRYFGRYLLWAMPIAVPLVVFNLSLYHSVLPSYYRWYKDFSVSTFPEALVGHLLSPSRGLFIFSPVFLLSIWGVVSKFKQKRLERLDHFLIGIAVVHWMAVSIWPVWWGGASFGPRILSDMIPYLTYWLIPTAAALSHLGGWKKIGLVAASLCLVGMSFFVHYRGANVKDVIEWNAWPINVDWRPERVWDMRDIQFLRGIKWGIPANVSVSGVTVEQIDVDAYLRLGTNDLRLRWFDAATSLIAPPDKSWIAIADRQSVAKDLAPLFDGATPQISGRTMIYNDAYRIYNLDLGARILELAQQTEQVAMWSPDVYPDPARALAVTLPVAFGQTADLIGFRVIPNLQLGRVKVISYWRAGRQVVVPLQLFAHAIGPDQQIVAQEDRLDVPSNGWWAGDVIVQINRMQIPAGAGPVWLEMGLYNLESGERLPVIVDGREVDRRLLLKQIEIK